MKVSFFVIGAVLVLASIGAYHTFPDDSANGKTRLVWVTDNNPVRAEQVALFNKLNPDLELVIDPANTAMEKVIVQCIGGVGPDLFDSFGIPWLQVYKASGVAYDLTDYLEENGIRFEEITWPITHSSSMIDGRVYGFPCNATANAMWFNKNVFDEAGIPYPRPGWSWDDLITIAKKLTVRDERGRPVRFGLYWDWFVTADVVFQHGGRYFTPDGTRCTLDTPEAAAGLQLVQDLMYKHKIAPSPVEEAALATQGGWGSGGITFLMSGRVAMAYGGRWWLNLLRQQKDLRLGVVEIPYAKVQAPIGRARSTMVNANGPNRDKALRFIKFLASREYNELVNDQADAIAAVKAYCFTDRFLHNPNYPNEDFNAVWRDVISRSMPDEYCPFLRGGEMAPIWTQMDLIRANAKRAEPACRDAAKNANERIIRNARLSPRLGVLYEQLTGRKP